MASWPSLVKFIIDMFHIGVSHCVMPSLIVAVSKYHIPDKDSNVNVSRHLLVYTTKKMKFWQQRLPLPKYLGTYCKRIFLKFI